MKELLRLYVRLYLYYQPLVYRHYAVHFDRHELEALGLYVRLYLRAY